MTELVSVIIPVYNVEKYIRTCLDSVLAQSWTNLEIFLIDDGSDDGSEKICDEYAGRDKRIIVVHQANRGLSAARNAGLALAHGEYLVFVDSDDCIRRDFVQRLHQLMAEQAADIGICDYECRKKGSFSGRKKKKETLRKLDAVQMLERWHGKDTRIETVVWNKMYRRTVFGIDENRIIFPEGKLFEDVYITHRLIANAQSCVITSEKMYEYTIRKSGIVRAGVTKKKVMDSWEAQDARMKFFQERHFDAAYERLLIGAMKMRMLHYCRYGEEDEDTLFFLKRVFDADYRKVMGSKEAGIFVKILFWAFYRAAWIFRKIDRVLGSVLR